MNVIADNDAYSAMIDQIMNQESQFESEPMDTVSRFEMN